MSEQSTPASRYVQAMPIGEIFESKHNPRKHFDPEALKELEQSIREKGVLTPLLLRPNGKGHEIAAGHRRFRAARAAGLEAVPAVVRDMSDAELLEVLVIENDQREDVHPLEEASGYHALMKTAKYDVARIAERIGRSAKYVYDRLKLMDLIPKAQELFLAGKFSAGHAILLARLKPEDQKRAIEIGDEVYHKPALFRDDRTLFDDAAFENAAKKDPYLAVKPSSVREFQGWIQDHVKADPAGVDAFLFPETAVMLDSAAEQDEKVILITRDYRPSDDVREAAKGQRIHGEQAWTRADGEEKSKTCDRSVIGFVACGPGQGETFLVCVNKEKCEVHYGAEIRARKKRAKETAKGGAPAQKVQRDFEREEQKRKDEEARRKAHEDRYRKTLPALLKALAAKVADSDAGAAGPLARYLVRDERYGNYFPAPASDKLVEIGHSPEELVRFVAFQELRGIAVQYRGMEQLPKILKSFGLDYGKLLNEAAPVEKVQTAAKPERGTCRKCGCTEEAACPGGCGWVDKAETKCSSCFAPKAAKPKKGGRS